MIPTRRGCGSCAWFDRFALAYLMGLLCILGFAVVDFIKELP